MGKADKKAAGGRLVRSYITSALSISLVLTLMGAVAVFAVNAGNIAAYFRENMVISVILEQNVSERDAFSLTDELLKAPYVKSAEYIDVERGEKELETLLGEDFLDVFSSSPVPASIDLHLNSGAVNGDSLEVIKTLIECNDKVREVSYQETLVEALNSNLRKILAVTGALVLLLLVISFALINNTVRLNIHSRRFTIHTMRLVGASRRFIRRPFVIQSTLLGCISGLVSVALLLLIMQYVKRDSALLYSLFEPSLVIGVMVLMVVAGAAICAVSAALVVNRLAYTSKNELYY